MSEPNRSTGQRLFYWWADHTWVQAFAFVCVTTLAVIGLVHPKWVTQVWGNSAEEAANESVQPVFPVTGREPPPDVEPFQVGGGDAVLVAFVSDSLPGDLFTSERLCALQRVSAGIQDMPQVRSVLWLDNVPVLISLVGLTDSVHLMVEIRQQRASGLETPEAARRGIARVGLACLLTSVTTAIGFVSLTWAHHEIVREFGWCCVVGVAMTFVSVLTVIPLGCRSPLGRRLHVGLGKSLVDGQLRRIGPVVDWVLERDRIMARVAIVATIVLALLSLDLTPDEKRYSGLSESGEAAQGLRRLDRSLGGLEFGRVQIVWSDGTADTEVLSVLKQVDTLLSSEPLLGHPLGLHELLDALPGQGDAAERMSLLELLPPQLKRAFYIPEYNQATIQFRIQDLGIAAYNDAFTRVEASLAEMTLANPSFQLNLDGNAIWRWRNIYQIVTDLATSLGTASVVIWLVLTMVYRSVRIGLISIVPNLFPLAATAAMLMTTIVLVAGLGSAILGDSRDARIFGVMGCLTLTTALFADIVLLPALLSRFAKPANRS